MRKRSRRVLRKAPEQVKVTYLKKKDTEQKIHIVIYIAKERDKKMSKKDNLKVGERKTWERESRQA